MRHHRGSIHGCALIAVVLAAALGAGCDDRTGEDTGVDGGTGTPLDGSIQCSDITCASGQLCSTCAVSDGSVPPQGTCHDVPAGCAVVDCAYGTCPSCLDLCFGMQGGVSGRTLSCPCVQ